MLNLTEHQETFSKQLPKNLIANISYFILNIFIGLFLVPFFIKTLGVVSYGVIPLATSVTSYVSLVTQSLNASVSRYLTIDLQKQDFKKANIIFNTAIFGTLVITLLTIPIIVIVAYYSPFYFDIPTTQKQDVFILFLGVMGSFLVRTWGSNFGVSLFAFNRLDLQNIINAFNIILQTALIIVLFTLYPPKLSYIGYSYLISAVATLFVTIIFSKKVNPYLKVNIHNFRISQVKDLGVTGGWIIIDQIGTLLLFQMDLILVNKLFGTAAGGEYSIALMWSTLITSFASMFASVLTPVILTYYAKEKFEELVTVSKSAVKIMGLSMALPIGLICGFSPIIISWWVGPNYARVSPLMWILLGHLAINMSVLPLFPINVSYNKLRIPAIATIFSGIANLLLALTLSTTTGLGYYGVAIAGAIVLTARHTFFVPMYATKVLGIPKNPFKNSLIQVGISTVLVAGITSLNYYLFSFSSLLAVTIYCFIFSLVYSLISLFIFFNKSEREIIESFVSSLVTNILKINKNRNY